MLMLLIVIGFIICFYAGNSWAKLSHKKRLMAVLSSDEKLAIHFSKALLAFKRGD